MLFVCIYGKIKNLKQFENFFIRVLLVLDLEPITADDFIDHTLSLDSDTEAKPDLKQPDHTRRMDDSI